MQWTPKCLLVPKWPSFFQSTSSGTPLSRSYRPLKYETSISRAYLYRHIHLCSIFYNFNILCKINSTLHEKLCLIYKRLFWKVSQRHLVKVKDSWSSHPALEISSPQLYLLIHFHNWYPAVNAYMGLNSVVNVWKTIKTCNQTRSLSSSVPASLVPLLFPLSSGILCGSYSDCRTCGSNEMYRTPRGSGTSWQWFRILPLLHILLSPPNEWTAL